MLDFWSGSTGSFRLRDLSLLIKNPGIPGRLTAGSPTAITHEKKGK